jgi:hypothetical protein
MRELIYGKPRIVDDYFPQWMVERVSLDLEYFPVTYTNSPYKDFQRCRFFGNMLMEMDRWTVPIERWWFVDYFNMCIYNDICKDLNLPGHCHRILLNGQVPGQDGHNHSDSDYDTYLTAIYMGHGTSGSTVFVNDRDEDYLDVPFKEGRLVLFNSMIWHRGEGPKEGYRVSLGAVYPMKNLDELHDKPPRELITPLGV